MEPKFKVTVQLSGEDGNAFAILGRVVAAIRNEGATKAQIDQFYKEATSGDYDHLLQTTCKWVEVQ